MICITGAGGQVGGAVMRTLLAHEIPIRVAFNSPAKASQAKAMGLDTALIDYADTQSLLAGFAGCKKLFLVGPNHPDQDSLEMNAVAAAKDAGIEHIVKVSVMNTEDDAYVFGRVNRRSEIAIEESGLNWTFLRASQFMQNLSTYMAYSIRGQNIFHTACGQGKLAHLDMRDIARMALPILQEDGHDQKAYTLTGPEAYTYDEVASLLSAILGRPIAHHHLSVSDFYTILRNSGVDERFAYQVSDLDRYFSEGGVAKVSSDIEEITGKKASSLMDFLKEQAQTGVWGTIV